MKLSKIFILIGISGILNACGSNNPTTQTSLPLGYGQTGVTGQIAGCAGSTGATLNQIALYSGNQVIGYKITSSAVGVYNNNMQTAFQLSVPVCAGDQLMVNATSGKYGVAQAYCGSGLITGYVQSDLGGTISNLSATLNGQAIASTATAAQSGTLVLSGSYPAINRGCNLPYSGTATISYYVDLSQSVTIQRCVAVTGAAMTCPY